MNRQRKGNKHYYFLDPGVALREKAKQRGIKKLGSLVGRRGRHHLPASYGGSQLDFVSYLYIYDRHSNVCQVLLTYQELAYNFAFIFISAGAFGTGLGQLLVILMHSG